MSKPITKLFLASTLVTSTIMFGCSSDDSATPAATVPAGAVTITDANAVQVVTDTIATGNELLNLFELATAVDINLAVTPGNIVNLVLEKMKDTVGTSVVSTPTGVIIPDTCTGGGDVIIDVTSTATSDSGTVTLIECIELGITLNGLINFNSTNDVPNTGDFTDSFSGNISGSDGVDTATLTGLSFNETGNDISGDYTINTYTFSADVNGTDGFLSELETPIAGNDGSTCPDSGSILVTGADNTQGKGTIVPGISVDNDIKVEYKDAGGNFVEATGSPVPCTTVF